MASTSPLKRVSAHTEATVSALAEREDRTFIAQLDRIVAAGLQALGEPLPPELKPATATKPRARRRERTAAPEGELQPTG